MKRQDVSYANSRSSDIKKLFVIKVRADASTREYLRTVYSSNRIRIYVARAAEYYYYVTTTLVKEFTN